MACGISKPVLRHNSERVTTVCEVTDKCGESLLGVLIVETVCISFLVF